MLKLVTVLLVLLAGVWPARACSGTELDLRGRTICGEYSDDRSVRSILRVLGLAGPIEVYRVEERQSFAWILARHDRGIRFVTYFDEDAARRRSGEIGWLAGRYIQMHEVGHHVCGHVDAAYWNDTAITADMEREADQFAGWAMRQSGVTNGATLTQVALATSTFMGTDEDGVHDSRAMRRWSFIQGWKHGPPSHCNQLTALDNRE